MSGTRASLSTARGRSGYLPGWEGLRAIAATGVLVLHASVFRLGGNPRAQDFVAQLQAGVQVFFVVSGFVITRPFIAAILDGRALPGLRSYAIRRSVRIFPAYWVALVVTAVILRETYLVTVRDWVVNLALLQVYSLHEFSRGISIAWTLSVEVSFYVFVPLFFLGIRRLARHVEPVIALVGSIVGVGVASCIYMQWTVSTGRPLWTFWLPFQLPVFLVGTMMAVVAAVAERRERVGALELVGRLAPLWWLAALAALVAAAELFGTSILYRVQHQIGMQVLYGLFATFLVLPVAWGFRPRGVIGRLLTSRPLVAVGLVSYGIYLWHHQIVQVLEHDWFHWSINQGPAIPFTMLVFALALGVATLSWHLLERPLIRWARGLTTDASS